MKLRVYGYELYIYIHVILNVIYLPVGVRPNEYSEPSFPLKKKSIHYNNTIRYNNKKNL